MRRAVLLIGVMAIAVGAVSACGGSDAESDTSSSAGTITKAEFVKQADAICAKAVKRRFAAIESFQTPEDKEPSPAEREEQILTVITEAVLPPLAQMSDELSELPLPKSSTDQAQAMVDGYANGIAETEEDPAKAATSAVGPFEKPNNLAVKLGIDSCDEI